MPFFDIFASPRWSPLRMRTKVVSFFIFSKSFQTKKKIKALRPKMTKIASRGGGGSCLKDRDTQSTMGASIARKRTRLGPRVLRHQVAQVCASSCLLTCFSCAAMVFRYSKRACTFFTCDVPSEVMLLEFPPCQTPMCGVAYSCSNVLLMVWVVLCHTTWPENREANGPWKTVFNLGFFQHEVEQRWAWQTRTTCFPLRERASGLIKERLPKDSQSLGPPRTRFWRWPYWKHSTQFQILHCVPSTDHRYIPFFTHSVVINYRIRPNGPCSMAEHQPLTPPSSW